MFDNLVLRRIFGPKGDGRASSTEGERINAFKILFGKPVGKRPLGRLWHGWEDNIKIDHQ
jgi:hypothetical protein